MHKECSFCLFFLFVMFCCTGGRSEDGKSLWMVLNGNPVITWHCTFGDTVLVPPFFLAYSFLIGFGRHFMNCVCLHAWKNRKEISQNHCDVIMTPQSENISLWKKINHKTFACILAQSLVSDACRWWSKYTVIHIRGNWSLCSGKIHPDKPITLVYGPFCITQDVCLMCKSSKSTRIISQCGVSHDEQSWWCWMNRGTSVSDAYNTLLLSMQRDLWPILVVRPNTWQFTLFCNVFLIVCFCYTREQVCGDKSCQQRALCNQISRSGPGLLLRIVPQCLLVCCVSLECQSWFYRYTLSKVCWYVHKSIGRLTMSGSNQR